MSVFEDLLAEMKRHTKLLEQIYQNTKPAASPEEEPMTFLDGSVVSSDIGDE